MDFMLAEGAYVWRPLRLDPNRPMQSGWDVYALQTALMKVGEFVAGGADGYFGGRTDDAVTSFQGFRELEVDGIAGGQTQTELGHVIARRSGIEHGLPRGLPYGTLEHESSNEWGNHTAPYPDGSRDIGIVERNTNFSTVQEGFDAKSVDVLAKQIRDQHDRFVGMVPTSRRAWELACLTWNNPSWAETLAHGGELSPESQAKADAYISSVTAYARW